MTKDQACQQYAFAANATPSNILELFPTLHDLLQFANDTGNLSWPDTYGESPWDFAFSVAYRARGGRVTNPACLKDKVESIALNYRKAAGVSHVRNENGELKIVSPV